MRIGAEPIWAVTPEKVDVVVRRLVQVGRPRKIFLFGSYVRGETHRDSDLDVLVVADDRLENTRKESVRLRSAVNDIRSLDRSRPLSTSPRSVTLLQFLADSVLPWFCHLTSSFPEAPFGGMVVA
jgi:predicted nucleotidyltransferase